MKPKPNEVYKRRGFRFIIHFIKKGYVYLVRIPKGIESLDDRELMRIPLRAWNNQMKGAKPLGRKL